MTPDFSKFEEIAGVIFRNKQLLRQAFTHRSFLNENKDTELVHNERLEFLGDAVLELAVTDFLYRTYTNATEGDLTAYRSALVNADTLSEVAQMLHMNDYLLSSRGEKKDVGRARQYILANTVEAVIGAMYIDQGYEPAKYFIARHILPLVDKIIAERSWIDAKSLFQEKAQEEAGVTPLYKTIREEGPDHSKKFTVGVYLKDVLIGEGSGDSKQDAEQKAARKALEVKKW
jgi:ribonuclease-3